MVLYPGKTKRWIDRTFMVRDYRFGPVNWNKSTGMDVPHWSFDFGGAGLFVFGLVYSALG
jgi:hypothetical protein